MQRSQRVLKPKGLFYITFGPLWSSAKGHHVFAKTESKEARFWKAGKNPVPDYAHLLMTPEEMRTNLQSGPCAEELIEPILHWIYHGNDINRCTYEEYIKAFHESSLVIQRMLDVDLTVDTGPDAETLTRLIAKYGSGRNFSCSTILAIFRQLPRNGIINTFIFKCSVKLKKRWYDVVFLCAGQIFKRFPEIKPFANRFKQYFK